MQVILFAGKTSQSGVTLNQSSGSLRKSSKLNVVSHTSRMQQNNCKPENHFNDKGDSTRHFEDYVWLGPSRNGGRNLWPVYILRGLCCMYFYTPSLIKGPFDKNVENNWKNDKFYEKLEKETMDLVRWSPSLPLFSWKKFLTHPQKNWILWKNRKSNRISHQITDLFFHVSRKN